MMYRWLIFMMLVLFFTVPAGGADEFVQNGDWSSGDNYWTEWDYGYNMYWKPSWSVTSKGPTPPEGTAAIIGGSGSEGWYQLCRVPAGEYVQLSADWAGDLTLGGWAEIYLFAIPKTYDHAAIIKRIESHKAEDIAFSKTNITSKPYTWGWQSAGLSPYLGGNRGKVINDEYAVVVALRVGTKTDASCIVSWDNISLTYDTPGPTTTAITYQGRLGEAGEYANGQYDMQFKLFGFPTGQGSQQGSTIVKDEVEVYEGYFTVQLDFWSATPDIFNGESRWLEIGVRPGELEDPNDYNIIDPRQEITPAPYALYTLKAGDADTLDGQDASDFFSSTDDYGRPNVASNLYEGAQTLTDKYVNEGQSNSITSAMIVNSTITASDLGDDSVDVSEIADDAVRENHIRWSLIHSASDLNGGIISMTNTSDGTAGNYPAGISAGANGNPNGYRVMGVMGGAPGLGQGSPYGSLPLGKIGVAGVSDDGYGVAGVTDDGTGVYGYSTAASSTQYGGYFKIDSSNGYGVYGNATNDGSVQTYGGWFQTAGGSGRGVYGYASNSTGTNYGGKFEAAGSTGRAVYGLGSQTGNDIQNYGGYFKTNGGSGRGIYAEALNGGWGTDTNGVYGGYFLADGQYSAALYAKHNTSETYARLASYGTGVTGFWTDGAGHSNYSWLGTQDYGVYGTASTGSSFGVYGNSSGTNSFGGYFTATNTGGIGVYARGSSYAGKFIGNVLICGSDFLPVLELGKGLDYAEGFDVTPDDEQEIEPGCVLIIDPDNPGQLALSSVPYDSKVAGIVAGAKDLGSGVRLGIGEYDHDVALAGRVYCNVDATAAAIEPGDLLTTSSTPGYAMKATDPGRSHGAILGKAMEKLEKGQKGQILVLVTLQ